MIATWQPAPTNPDRTACGAPCSIALSSRSTSRTAVSHTQSHACVARDARGACVKEDAGARGIVGAQPGAACGPADCEVANRVPLQQKWGGCLLPPHLDWDAHGCASLPVLAPAAWPREAGGQASAELVRRLRDTGEVPSLMRATTECPGCRLSRPCRCAPPPHTRSCTLHHASRSTAYSIHQPSTPTTLPCSSRRPPPPQPARAARLATARRWRRGRRSALCCCPRSAATNGLTTSLWSG